MLPSCLRDQEVKTKRYFKSYSSCLSFKCSLVFSLFHFNQVLNIPYSIILKNLTEWRRVLCCLSSCSLFVLISSTALGKRPYKFYFLSRIFYGCNGQCFDREYTRIYGLSIACDQYLKIVCYFDQEYGNFVPCILQT